MVTEFEKSAVSQRGVGSESPDERQQRATRSTYVRPRLTLIATFDELIEVLGPAQANYGGTGFP